MMEKYYDFFTEMPFPDDGSMDEFINHACTDNYEFSSNEEKMNFLNNSRAIIKSELFTCYSYLKEKGLLEEYHAWRDGK